MRLIEYGLPAEWTPLYIERVKARYGIRIELGGCVVSGGVYDSTYEAIVMQRLRLIHGPDFLAEVAEEAERDYESVRPSVLHPEPLNGDLVRDVPLTAAAKAAGVTGRVFIRCDVLPTGMASNIQVVRGLGHGLDERAVERVGRLRWQPATDLQHGVSVSVHLPVRFHEPKPSRFFPPQSDA